MHMTDPRDTKTALHNDKESSGQMSKTENS